MPLLASLWYGLVLTAEALGPFMIYEAYKRTALETVTRNTAHKNAWNVMRYGGIAIYAIPTLIWPLSYFGIKGVSDLYITVYKFFGTFGTLLHLTTAILMWYAASAYLYEPILSYATVQYEWYAYFIIVYAFFWPTTRALKVDFYQFYNMDKITILDI